MTNLTIEVKHCGICKKIGKYTIITSTNSNGSPDLDTRPAEMKRSTVNFWVERCSCGYCSPNVAIILENAVEFIKSEVYKKQLNKPNFPEIANSFLCWSLIEENNKNLIQACWCSIYAAWIGDDSNNKEAALYSRKRAVNLLKQIIINKQYLMDQDGSDKTIMVDLLRRSGEFEEALNVCNESKDISNEILQKIIEYQKNLIKNKDISCHKIIEITEFNKVEE